MKVVTDKLFSDMDFLLMFLSFCSYVAIRFVTESGWILGSLFSISAFLFLRRSSKVRHTIYLYMILLFTSASEQRWLQRKFTLNSKIYPGSGHDQCFDQNQLNDVLNKTLEAVWPFIKSFVEEKIRRKIEKLSAHINDTKMKPLLQYLIDFRTEEINLGEKPPLVESLRVFPSRKMNVFVYDIGFTYCGNAVLKFSTHLKNICVQNFKVNGHLRIEIGPLSTNLPFVQEIKAFMTEEPQLDFRVSNVPQKIENLVKIISLERISETLVMPNQIHFLLRRDNIQNYFPPGVILVHVVEAQDLPNKETFSQSDPYCVICLGAQKATTTTIRNNLNPVWKFKTQMICFCDPRCGDFDVSFSIYDYDLFFNDFLFWSKLSVRRIMEEKFVDEWLHNEKETKDDAKRGRLRIQAIWQNVSSDLPSLEKEQETEKNVYEEEERNSNCRISHYSDAVEINSLLNAVENLTMKEDEDDNGSGLKETQERDECEKYHFAKAVLLVWIESAEKLEPLWEDFQIELKFYDSVEKTSYVPRDTKGKWCFRQRFLIPVIGHLEDEIIFKMVSRSRSKCVGELALRVSASIKDCTEDFCLKDFHLKDKNQKDMNSSLKLLLALKDIEPVSPHCMTALRRAELEASTAAVRQPLLQTAPLLPKQCNPFVEFEDGKKASSKKTSSSVFKFTEIGWDVFPSFVLSNPFEKKALKSIKGRQNNPSNDDDNDEGKQTLHASASASSRGKFSPAEGGSNSAGKQDLVDSTNEQRTSSSRANDEEKRSSKRWAKWRIAKKSIVSTPEKKPLI